MKLNILFLSIITFFVQPIFAQDNIDDSVKIKNITIQEPLLDRLALEKQFGTYEPPRTPSPLPNMSYKNLDTSMPNTKGGNTRNDIVPVSSLTILENSLLEKSGDGKKMGGSISMSLAEAENIANQNISNENDSKASSIVGLSIILVLVILGVLIVLFTNKKTDSVAKKDEINDNKIDSNIVGKEPFDVDRIISSLEKIQMLKESNVITEQQFEKLKKELID